MLPVDEPPITPALIRDRVTTLMGRLRAAAEGAGRDPDGFRLVAVTKGFGWPRCAPRSAAGLHRLRREPGPGGGVQGRGRARTPSGT